MRNVTRRLLKHMIGSSGPIKVEYRSDPDSKANDCIQNAYNQCAKTNDRHQLVSGWAIAEYNKEKDWTEVVTHYWNYDPDTDTHYDTTPITGTTLEYVEQPEISRYRYENSTKTKTGHYSCHQPELVFTSNNIILIHSIYKNNSEMPEYVPIGELKNSEEEYWRMDYKGLIRVYNDLLEEAA